MTSTARVFGGYPERRAAPDGRTPRFPLTLDDLSLAVSRTMGGDTARFLRHVRRALRHPVAPGDRIAVAARLSAELRATDMADRPLARLFAMVHGIVADTHGLQAHPVQLAGAFHMLKGRLVEMETGEGKTLTAVFAASAQALFGRGTHVVTTNDYLADRDAREMAPIYRALGLSVACVRMDMSESDRREAWRARIVYVTPKQLMFDYLRDRIRLGSRSLSPLRKELAVLAAEAEPAGFYLRGLEAAIIDEADSVLIDEAVVPLIISRQEDQPEQARVAREAIRLARALEEDRHFTIKPASRDVKLTSLGRQELARVGPLAGAPFTSKLWREQYMEQALMALHLFRRDRDYIIRDRLIEIVDINTGRTMPDRSWERGLHQMIQAKEELPVTAPNEAMARISHQAFFRRYLHLSGMSGTLGEVKTELRRIYGPRVVRLPTHHRLRRKAVGITVTPTTAAKDARVIARTRALVAAGRPVLIGTRTVGCSERLSVKLAEAGIAHRVLNARQDDDEAQVIARAGEPGAVTVATNMAGRGTDIRIGEAVRQRGGLHVIATERHESRRIDRQLFGRTARQGDPGSYEEIVSLDDEIVLKHAPAALRLAALAMPGLGLRRLLLVLCQRAASRRGVTLRADLARAEDSERKALTFVSSSRS